MRIKIECDVGQGLTLPINYNEFLAGAIYQFLRESNREYAHFLHEDGYEVDSKHFKLFTFSQLNAKNRKPMGDQIFFGSTLTWYVSSPKETFLENFAGALLTEGTLRIGKHRLPVKDVDIPRPPRFASQMTFRCLSPIVMSTKRERNGELVTHYCLPDEPEFSDLVRQNLIRKYEAVFGRPPKKGSFSMTFDDAYIQRRGRVTRLVDYKGIKIRGVLCPFHVIGSPELLEVGYECGFGEKNSLGFGMVEVGRR